LIDNTFTVKKEAHDILLWAFFIFNYVLSDEYKSIGMLKLAFVELIK